MCKNNKFGSKKLCVGLLYNGTWLYYILWKRDTYVEHKLCGDVSFLNNMEFLDVLSIHPSPCKVLQ
jgi:hypothetical protein